MRRQFTTCVGGAAAGVRVAPALLRARNLNDQLNIAIIGAGGRGGSNLRGVSGEDIVALCDVDQRGPRVLSRNPPTPRSTATSGKCLISLYRPVAGAVHEIMQPDHVVGPVEVLMQMQRPSKKGYEDWRFARIPYLERVLVGNLSKLREWLVAFNLRLPDGLRKAR